MKSILLPLTGTIDTEATMAAAAAMARQFRATLTGLYVRPDPRSAIPFMGEGLTADMIQTLCDTADRESQEQEERVKTLFTGTMQAAGLKLVQAVEKSDGAKITWRVATGNISDHVGRRARTADLAICLQPDSASPDTGDIFHDLLFRSGRAVLMVPKGHEGPIGRHIMIAWNGRAEGARAVASAVPLLVEANTVTVVQIGDVNNDRPPLDDVCQYLLQHGIMATADKRPMAHGAVGEQLLAAADAHKADMIVIGAYSHSRWRELILGGVTRWIVGNSAKPVFMSH